MDFSRLHAEVDALLKSTATPEPAPVVAATGEGTKMDAAQFAVYASEQVAKAQAEAAEGKSDLAKSRIEALSAEVEKVTKFAFAPGELPAVSVFKAADQTTHQEASAPQGETAPDAQAWVQKSKEMGEFLATTLDSLKAPKAQGDSGLPETAPATKEEWPADMASTAPADPAYTF